MALEGLELPGTSSVCAVALLRGCLPPCPATAATPLLQHRATSVSPCPAPAAPPPLSLVLLAGFYNTFAGNTCNLGGAPGECITIQCEGRNLGLCGNRVTCDNVVSGGSGVLSNLGCS